MKEYLSFLITDKTNRNSNGDINHDDNMPHETSFEIIKSRYFPKTTSVNKSSDSIQDCTSSFASSYMSGNISSIIKEGAILKNTFFPKLS